MKTIKELKQHFKGKYDAIEVYEPIWVGQHYPSHFHTDNCRETYNYNDESIVGLYDLMSIEEYDNSILANSGFKTIDTDFEGEKILVCMLKGE